MRRIKRLGKISMLLFIFWLMVTGISMKTNAVETNSSTTESYVTSSKELLEQQAENSSTESLDSTISATEESTTESQTKQQPIVKAKKEYGSELLTNVSLTDIANNPIHRVKSSDKIKVNYSFYLPDEAQAGDELTFELPAILQMVNYNDFPLLSENGTEIGIAKIDRATNKVTVTFNDYVTDHNTISGQFFFWVKLVSNQTTEGVNPIPLPINGATSDLELMVNKINGVSTGTTNPTTIFKSGKFDSLDPQKINWTITINNSGQNLLLPIINDSLGAGQQLLGDSFGVNYRNADKVSLKKYQLPSNIQGDITSVIPTVNGFILSLQSLGSYSGDKGYVSAVVNYSTKVTDSSVKYVNNANTLDEDGTPQSRNASLTNYANGGVGNGNVNQAIDVITDKIDEVESVDLEELTDSSAKKLTEVKENAQTVVDNENSTLTDLEEAAETLINQLVTTEEIVQPTDIQELETVIEENNELKKDDYTPESWTPWNDKKTEAINLVQIAKETPQAVSRNKIKQTTQELKTARTNLIEVTETSETSEAESSSETSTTETTNTTQSNSSIPNEKSDGNQQRLLKTGEIKSPILMIIGAVLSAVAALIIFNRKQAKK
ncbi:LPXTG cell wall anchor domain-containing protein [Candidatus Enterococcus ikei]|uniref:LPXTG cell wall anchor domain-containing protein n=1 Tax=Candidatus Enterococcus ikei TaxID=2815326 RepID=A0ABS3GW80_9ENTE|nr:LPXTG cell wall anchor domain-containing protein [Enterococcus sp. DIV0869a]MBO0439526.1 LPXTG cell wall anchor domain-containing protein [Enterococcus sp. DIV0869a]